MSARFDPPIVICSRDRVWCLRRLVDWLERAGHERIVIVDNASTYEPLLDYLDGSPHQVVVSPRTTVNARSGVLGSHHRTGSATRTPTFSRWTTVRWTPLNS